MQNPALLTSQIDLLRTQGYLHIPGFFSPSLCAAYLKLLPQMEADFYTEANLSKNAVYISDRTETRVSHAMMVSSDGSSSLPEVKPAPDLVRLLVQMHHSIVGLITGQEVPASARAMFNFQKYLAGSKPVAEHYDGHYLEYEKVSGTEFRLLRGLLPRYVFVFTLENENTGEVQGTTLRNPVTNEVIQTKSGVGDLLIFNNIRFRHSVPQLDKPRTMMGLRCFDSQAFYFSAQEFSCCTPLPDSSSPGFIKESSDEFAVGILQNYYREEWPEHWKAIQKQGAVF